MSQVQLEFAAGRPGPGRRGSHGRTQAAGTDSEFELEGLGYAASVAAAAAGPRQCHESDS